MDPPVSSPTDEYIGTRRGIVVHWSGCTVLDLTTKFTAPRTEHAHLHVTVFGLYPQCTSQQCLQLTECFHLLQFLGGSFLNIRALRLTLFPFFFPLFFSLSPLTAKICPQFSHWSLLIPIPALIKHPSAVLFFHSCLWPPPNLAASLPAIERRLCHPGADRNTASVIQ